MRRAIITPLLLLAVFFTTYARTYYDAAVFQAYNGNPSNIITNLNNRVSFNPDGSLYAIDNKPVTGIERDQYGRLTKVSEPVYMSIEYTTYSYLPTVIDMKKYPEHAEYHYGAGLPIWMETNHGRVNFVDYDTDGYGNWIRRGEMYGGKTDQSVRVITYNTADTEGVPSEVSLSKIDENTTTTIEQNNAAPIDTAVVVEESAEVALPADSIAATPTKESPATISATISHVRLQQSGTKLNGKMALSFNYTITGLSKATVRLTLIRPDGSTYTNPRLQASSGWAGQNGRITRTFTIKDGTDGNVGVFKTTFNSWMLQGAALLTSACFRIEILGPNGHVLQQAVSPAVSLN